jgi:amino-acid N-acetyltransferase
MNEVEFSMATAENLTAVRALLAECGLSSEGLESITGNCILAKAGSSIVGTVALEPCGQWALLRSLAVAPLWRKRSLASVLCAKAISHARLLGVEKLCLLTTDAAPFFSRLDFKRIERAETPPGIQQTTQFRTSCPKSAVCMMRDISRDTVDAG